MTSSPVNNGLVNTSPVDTSPIETIYLDMDGVLFDFVGAAVRVHGLYEAYERWQKTGWPEGGIHFWRACGIDDEDFWNQILVEGSRFWRCLPRYEWAHELVALCQEYQHAGAELIIATSDYPCPSGYCAAGKIQALRGMFGRDFSDYFIGRHKHKLASPRAVLIDDQESNLEAFSAAGGHAVPFPQPWNRWHDTHGDNGHSGNGRVEFVRKRLLEIAEKISAQEC